MDEKEGLVNEPETGTGEENSDPKPRTFTQEEVDKIIKGRIAKERKSWEKTLEEQRTEAEKLASMNEKEKKEYQDDKRLKDLEEREKAVTKRELTAEAITLLQEKGIPSAMSEFLDYTDADSVKASIERLSGAYQSSVQTSVQNMIKGKETMKKAPEGETITLESISTMSSAEINKNWDAIQELLKKK